MKKINYILIVVAILSVMFAFSILFKEGCAIAVNSKNKELVTESLKGKIKNTNDITIIILGSGWHSGELTIYHLFGRVDRLLITEGTKFGDLEPYIRENGFLLDNISFVLMGISGLITVYLLVYKFTTKKQN